MFTVKSSKFIMYVESHVVLGGPGRGGGSVADNCIQKVNNFVLAIVVVVLSG